MEEVHELWPSSQWPVYGSTRFIKYESLMNGSTTWIEMVHCDLILAVRLIMNGAGRCRRGGGAWTMVRHGRGSDLPEEGGNCTPELGFQRGLVLWGQGDEGIPFC
jgi:hypothetical protein